MRRAAHPVKLWRDSPNCGAISPMLALVHQLERAWDHYGLVLTVEDVLAMQAQLAKHNLLRHMPDGRRVHVVSHNGVAMYAGVKIDDRGRTIIATFLQADLLSAKRLKDTRKAEMWTRGRVARNRHRQRVLYRKIARGDLEE